MRPRWIRIGFRLAAVLLAVAPFVLIEAGLALLGWGGEEIDHDPFVGFSSVRPLFVPTADGSRYEIAPSRRLFFCPESFARPKPPGEVRIFCLGGSTVQGRPFAIETSFTTFLEINLRSADPSRRWEVVNCGGISYASYRLVPILREVLGYRPDLIVLYTGHNEFLEDREYGHLRDTPAVVAGAIGYTTRLRTCALLRRAYRGLAGSFGGARAPGVPILSAEVDARLDHRGGLAKYHRDDAWRRDVVRHFACNLERMVRGAARTGVPVILINPASNLRDCPPFKGEGRAGLSPELRRRWVSLCDRARREPDGRRAVTILREAIAIDDQHAGLHYLLAKRLDGVRRSAEARIAYLRAKELDVCPLRMLEEMHQALLEIARRTETPVVDARRLVEARSRDGIPGGYLLLDHVHPSLAGHRLIADAITDELIRRRTVRPRAGWQERRDAATDKHLASLGAFYYAKGRARLKALKEWAAGRVIPPTTRARPLRAGRVGRRRP